MEMIPKLPEAKWPKLMDGASQGPYLGLASAPARQGLFAQIIYDLDGQIKQGAAAF